MDDPRHHAHPPAAHPVGQPAAPARRSRPTSPSRCRPILDAVVARGACDLLRRRRRRAAAAGDRRPARRAPGRPPPAHRVGRRHPRLRRPRARARTRTARSRPRREMFEYGTALLAEKAPVPGRRPDARSSPADRGGPGRQRARAADVLQPADRGRQRDHPQLDRRRAARARRAPRPSGTRLRGRPRAAADGGRGDAALGSSTRPTTGARPPSTSSSAGRRSAPGDKVRCGGPRPTATTTCSTTRSASTSGATRTPTSPSATAATSAWAPTCPLEIRLVLDALLDRVDASSSPARSSGPAPTSTPASATSRCGSSGGALAPARTSSSTKIVRVVRISGSDVSFTRTTSRRAAMSGTRTSSTMSNSPLVRARYSKPGIRRSSSLSSRHRCWSTLRSSSAARAGRASPGPRPP